MASRPRVRDYDPRKDAELPDWVRRAVQRPAPPAKVADIEEGRPQVWAWFDTQQDAQAEVRRLEREFGLPVMAYFATDPDYADCTTPDAIPTPSGRWAVVLVSIAKAV